MKTNSRTQDVRLSVKIKASPKKIYQALTSARVLCRWWLEGAETDAKNMGRLRLVWPKAKIANRNLKEVRGFFVDIEPNKKIAWIWDLPSKGKYPPLSTFFIEAQGRLSEVTIVQAGFSADPKARKCFECARDSWEDCLAKLKLYLETEKTFKSQTLTLESVTNP